MIFKKLLEMLMLDANYFQFGPFFFVFFSDNVAVIRCITCGEMRKEHFSSSPSNFFEFQCLPTPV